MTNISIAIPDLPPEQQAIRDKCFHPTGRFVEFKREEIEQSIPDRFEQEVRLYPDRLAVKTKNYALTYDELNRAANCVARAILVQHETGKTVALLLEKDAPLISAILGVLKAGKIYVPLEPSFPKGRIASILEDSQSGLILTNKRNVSLVTEVAPYGVHVLDIDSLDSTASADNLGLSISPDNFTFILYTSGSTGKPKGVVDIHRNVLHDTMAYTNNFHICPADRLTLLHSCCVSASIHYLFGALLNGATLHPLDIGNEGFTDLATWLIHERISIYHSSTTVFRHFIETLTGAEEFPELRIIKLGSAQVSKNDLNMYKKHFSQSCLLVNALSSTETHTNRWFFMDKYTQISGNSVPVGYEGDHKKVLLLDESGAEVGPNEVGEIAVKSRYLTSGYWRMPELTQTKFLPDPKGGDERIYLTGDLGRMEVDGCLMHMGRKDFRVKIRGFTVEVAEIERMLLEHPNIREIVVTANEDNLGDKRLVAYLVSNFQPAPSISDLHDFLMERLPDYMVPSVFVRLDAMPLTPNGKIDRKALPRPGNSRPDLHTIHVAPSTPVENELAKIWAEVLTLDRVGIHDNFFQLGGHSLAATQVISRVIKSFKLNLSIKTLFESPTVKEMAMVIVQNEAREAGEKELSRLLTELELLTDEEAQRRLIDENK